MDPDALREKCVGAGNVDGHGAGWRVDAQRPIDLFLIHVLVDHELAVLDEISGRYAPFIVQEHKEWVFGCATRALSTVARNSGRKVVAGSRIHTCAFA